MANRGKIVVDIITGPCPGPEGCPVTVTPNNTNVCIDAGGVVIGGTCFDAVTPSNNVVTFNLGAVGVVIAATTTSLTVAFSTKPGFLDALTVVVANGNGNSGAPVQVATIIAACGPGCSFSRIPQPTYNSSGHAVSAGAAVGVTCDIGNLLVVKVTLVNGDWNSHVTVGWNLQELTLDNSKSCTGAGQSGKAMIFSCETAASATADVTVTVTGSVGAGMTVQPIRLVGSPYNVPDIGANASGASSAPSSGATAGTSFNCEIAEALILRLDGTRPGPAWQNDFIAGGNLNSSTLSQASEAWRIVDTAGSTADAAISETASGWAALVEIYR